MMRIVQQLFDALFPPRPNELILRNCRRLLLQPDTVSGTETLLSFGDLEVKAAITENKFHHNQTATRLLADALTTWLSNTSKPVVLLPVPLARARQKSRGYNQVEEILRLVSLPQVTVQTKFLKRVKETAPQTSLSKTERIKNVRGAFVINDTGQLNTVDKQYVLVDDVLTTGATMAAARATLARHLPPNATLTTLALAH